MASIYLASSWRNAYQPVVLDALRAVGHQVYDFRRPGSYTTSDPTSGFHWSDIDPEWKGWDAKAFQAALEDPVATKGYDNDFGAMLWADHCVLLLPSGRSAHLEAGFFAGDKQKHLHILQLENQEPELMYLMADSLHTSLESLIEELDGQ